MDIPKRIHQIWIQEEELPSKFAQCQESWKKYEEKGWKYKLWHGNEIRQLLNDNFPFLVECYDSARSYSSKSNFARYIILYLYGGVYVDTDMKSIRDISNLMNNAEFIACIETPRQLATCILASSERHDIFYRCLNYYSSRKYDPYQMSYLGSGPVFFSKRFGEYIRANGQSDKIVIYDTHVFLPVSFQKRADLDIDLTDPSLDGSYTIHYWDYSWKKSVFDISSVNLAIMILLGVLAIALLVWAIVYSVKCKK